MEQTTITPETLAHALITWPKWKTSLEAARDALCFPRELAKRTSTLYVPHIKCPNGHSLEVEKLGYKLVPRKENWREWDKWINGPDNALHVPLMGRQALAQLHLPQNFLRFWIGCFYSEYEDSQGKPNLEAIFPPDHEYQLQEPETGQIFYATLRKETLTSCLLSQLFKWWDDKYPPTADMIVCTNLSLSSDKRETSIVGRRLHWSEQGEAYIQPTKISGDLAPIVLYCPLSGHIETLQHHDSLTNLNQRIIALIRYQHSLLPRSLIFYVREAKEGIERNIRTKAMQMALAGKPFDELLNELYFSKEVQADLEIKVTKYSTEHERALSKRGFRKNFRDRVYKWLKDAGLKTHRAKGKWWEIDEIKNTT
jgi:hypothetical protein